MAKTLIIGGAGFIGAHLAKALALAGEPVDLLDNFSRGVHDVFLREIEEMPNVHLLDADMLDPSAISRLPHDYEVIYNFAAIIGVRHVLARPYEVLHKNVLILATSIELARQQKKLKRLVFASTSEVYAGSLLHMNMPVPTPENFPLALTELTHARTSYMLSKIYGEAMCQHSGVPFTVVRPHNIYGPRMGLVHVVPELFKRARELPRGGQLTVSSADHRRSFCYIDDAIVMLQKLAGAPNATGGTFNVGNQHQETSIDDVARMILRAIDRSDLELVPTPATPGSPFRRCPDMTRTNEVTKFDPIIDLAEGIQRTCQWYAAHVFTHDGVSAT